jgi:hypothetical protein
MKITSREGIGRDMDDIMNIIKNQKSLIYFGISLLLIVSIACGSSSTVSTQPVLTNVPSQIVNTQTPIDTAIPTDTPKPIPTKTSLPPTETQNPYLVNPGTFIVGTEIQPGIYRGNAGLDMSNSCYWERLKDVLGTLDSILANDNAKGQFYVEIKTSDYAFTTECELLPLDSLPPRVGDFPQIIEPGTYLVGKDIQPGLYKGQAGNDFTTSCYWERQRNVAGGFDAIIANDNAQAQFYVKVLATDFALTTECELKRVGE